MPKLNPTTAKKVAAAEASNGGSFLLPEGRYAARLLEVESRQGQKGEYWTWLLTDLHDTEGTRHPGKQWHNTSLSDASFGFLKAVFEAFGYTADSDTEEILGEWVTIHLVQEQIARGQRAGEMTNRVRSLAPFNPEDFAFDAAALPPVGGVAKIQDQV